MNLLDIINAAQKPALYAKGSAQMWTDEYISKQLLSIHLNEEIDLGSRKKTTIEHTVNWILNKVDTGNKLNILDLGCGPGLYTELLARKGHNVTGVDFSKTSIEHAKREAEKKNLNINYINSNYLELALLPNSIDLVILIYTDFGVLLPAEREKLLGIIKSSLKPGGIFIFDVLNDKHINSKVIQNNWEAAENGFWKNSPYLALSNSFLYEENKVILHQHTIIDGENNLNTYRFWVHMFSHSDLTTLLTKHNFNNLEFNEDVLPESNLWDGKNVTFCKAVNSI